MTWPTPPSAPTSFSPLSLPPTVTTSAKNQILYAQWIAKTYTITFVSEGATVSTQNVTYQGTYSTFPTHTKDGYNFLGWFTAETNGTKVEAGETHTIADNRTLYAHWQAEAQVGDFVNYGISYTDIYTNKAYSTQLCDKFLH